MSKIADVVVSRAFVSGMLFIMQSITLVVLLFNYVNIKDAC